ncbi:MAG: DUF2058 family protein [Myxococcales bacterium]|nr:DUF2058 family protein [Myxococcales bacterium]MCB9718815.1 DUF2058 family protein [Myxococcales bacterium]
MLDLKSKLAAAGLVTKEDVERAERAKAKKAKAKRGGAGRKERPGGRGKPEPARLRVAELRGEGKGAQYDAVRRFVEKVRLDDPARPPGEQAQTFHFTTAKGQIGRLVLEPDVHGWVSEGGAGIVAYMSNHGLAHAAVPAQAARDVGELFPLWLRVLKGHAGAGALEGDGEP